MAGIYAPIITNYPKGVVTAISNTGTSYEQILNSMGSFVYGVDSMYIQSNDVQQILQPLKFSKYDVNGTLQSYNQVVAVDPFQKQSSIKFDLSGENVVLQGRTTLDTQLLANEQLNTILYVDQLSNKAILGGVDIFSNDDFYQDYSQVANDLPVKETPISVVEAIKTIVDNSQQTGEATITINQNLTVSNNQDAQVVSTSPSVTTNIIPLVSTTKSPIGVSSTTNSGSIQYKPSSNIAATTPTTKKQNPTYWIYVVIGSALLVGRLFKKIKK
jgi:hypothetical protein